jgi:hypothetical protein
MTDIVVFTCAKTGRPIGLHRHKIDRVIPCEGQDATSVVVADREGGGFGGGGYYMSHYRVKESPKLVMQMLGWVPQDPPPATSGVALISCERQLQKVKWTDDHDDAHSRGEILAGALGLLVPWVEDLWKLREKNKPGSLKALTVAGALIAAEIDRRLRKGEQP